jgi:hypothetical protein
MNRLRHLGRDERGQILVIVAGGMIALLAIAALALEGGMLVLNRRDAQNASDLASVAGTRQVALHYVESARAQSAVWAAVDKSLTENDCVASDDCTWTAQFVNGALADIGAVNNSGAAIPTGSVGVHVNVNQEVQAIIGHAIGFNSWDVSTEAIARARGGQGSFPAGVMLPIAVCGWSNPTGNDCIQATNTPAPGNFIDFQPGQIYDLTDGKDAPGGFGWLSWTGSNSAGALADAICNPQNPAFSIDSPYDSPGSYGGVMGTNPSTGETWFPIDPGKSNANAVRSCLDGWITSGATVLLPIYDLVTGNGNNAAYHITGVAAFVLTSRSQPAIDNIQGYFVEYYPYTDVPGGITAPPPSPEDTTFQVGLVK